jgi:hypothetical protein
MSKFKEMGPIFIPALVGMAVWALLGRLSSNPDEFWKVAQIFWLMVIAFGVLRIGDQND